ncbi:MAG: carbon storage regulator [Planctomycetota bacterium]|nr:carbon storage regulator [Planctomycetaceae bacterium]MDQ3329308.1 carbon storage regulator [Planctomycetota bacterium]
MLVLSRRVGEGVCVGPGVTIRVVETKRGRVRLAIDAPAEVRISRSELPPLERSERTPLVELGS